MAFAFLFDLEFSHSLSRQRVFRDRLNPIDVYSDIEFIARYRITKCIFVQLQEKVVTFIHRSTTRSHSISPSTQLAVALQFLATCSFQTVVATSHGISQPSVPRCIGTVTDALCLFTKDFIVFPNGVKQPQNQAKILELYGFPKVLGCIDGTHVPILAPHSGEDLFVNRKNFHSIKASKVITKLIRINVYSPFLAP